MRIDPDSPKARQFCDSLPAHFYDTDIKFVFNILNIFSCIRESCENMPEKPVIDEKVLAFPGFDSFNEHEFYEFTERLMRNGWYEVTLGDHVPDARKPMLDKYERMIQCWNEAGNPRYPFTKEMVEKLLEARFYVPQYNKSHSHYQLPMAKDIQEAAEKQAVTDAQKTVNAVEATPTPDTAPISDTTPTPPPSNS